MVGRAPMAKKSDPVIGTPRRLTTHEWLECKFQQTDSLDSLGRLVLQEGFIKNEGLVAAD